ncbi:MAG: S41 family peptidase [Gammaproteobacteria bacterium]|nr:S41 family peptidase [Gammaproteobacteria bacterium]
MIRLPSILLAAAVGATLGFGAAQVPGWLRPQPVAAVPARDAQSGAPSHRLLDEVVGRIRREYVEPVPESTFDEAAVKGVVSNLDPHSAFLDAQAYDEMRATTTGSYSGVGIEVSAEQGRVVVVTPIDGSPAARAGVRAGDVVLAVDDRPVTPDRLEETIARMRGSAGTQVRLAVGRAGEPEPLLFTLERGEVHVHTVRAASLPGDYGYVRISQFSDSTPDDLVNALAGLMHAGPAGVTHPLRGLVLDLRGNPGGVLESAVSVADTFLDEGLIVRADGRTPEARFEMSATRGDALDGEPLVVLVDGGSASGSEIVAGALRDHGRATLMGERTFGKGSVQTVIPLRDGQALKLTTSLYYTPSGTSIHERGLEPDIVIPQLDDERAASAARPASPTKDSAVLTALQYLRDRGLGAHYAAAKPASAAR